MWCLAGRLGVKRFGAVLLAVAAFGAACHSITSPNEGLQGLSGCVFAMLMLAGGAQLERSKLATGASQVTVPLSYVLLAALFSLQELSGVSLAPQLWFRSKPRSELIGRRPLVAELPCRYAPRGSIELGASQWWNGPRTIARLAHFVGGFIGIAAAVWLGDGRLGPGAGHNPFE